MARLARGSGSALSRFVLVWSACALGVAGRCGAAPGDGAEGLSERWHGVWKGDMTASVPGGGNPKQFGMELHIAPLPDDPARCTWKVVYIDDGQRQERPYEIVAVDAAKGEYVIDEKNSIEIPGRMMGDVLHCPFSLGDVLLLATYRLEGESLRVDIVTMNTAEAAVTGGKDGAPQVALPQVRAVQWADLKRE